MYDTFHEVPSRRVSFTKRIGAERTVHLCVWMALIAVLFILSACGSRTEYLASELALTRESWDSLDVDVTFARRTAIGGVTTIQLDTVFVVLFDEAYDSLYTGPPGYVPIPDQQLGDQERLTIEACGAVKTRRICVQDVVRASPKQLEVAADVEYPIGSDFSKGRYAFSFRASRQRLGGEEWQPFEPQGISGHMLVWVDDPEAREQGTVRVPFVRSRGTFDLTTRPNHKDFRYFLDSQLLDEDTAFVHFEVYAGLSDSPGHVASIRKEVFWKTEDEREDDVRYFAREGAERLVDELGSFLGGRRAVAYVDRWDFDAQRQLYTLEIEVEWDGSLFDRGRYEVEGLLEVREDGSGATFELTDANRRAERRWRRRSEGESLQLGDLGSPSDSRTTEGRSGRGEGG